MDFVLLAFLLFYFCKGYLKGFVSTLFSLVGTFAIFFISLIFCDKFAETLQNIDFFNNSISNLLTSTLNGLFEGKFSSIEEFSEVLSNSKYGAIFSVLFKLLTINITFEGSLTAGEILSPTLSVLIFKVVSFIILFFGISFILKLIKLFFNKMIKICGMTKGNKLLGGFLGIFKGLLIFGVFYAIIVAIANFSLNEKLVEFVVSGKISEFIYQTFITKIINLFY